MSRLDDLVLEVEERLRQELIDQGHVAFGNLLNSVSGSVTREPQYIDISFYALDYAFAVNDALPASKVKYIPLDGDFREWIQLRFNTTDDREVKGIYFAIHNKWFKEGRPTQDSYRFSNNGKRTDWITDVFNAVVEDVANAAQQEIADRADEMLRDDSSST